MKRRETDDLELHSLAFQLNGANLEVNSNGANITLCIGVVRKSQKQARLRKTRDYSFER